jgi:hypothetical protein
LSTGPVLLAETSSTAAAFESLSTEGLSGWQKCLQDKGCLFCTLQTSHPTLNYYAIVSVGPEYWWEKK